MPSETLTPILEEGLLEVPVLDVHTHLDAAHLSARGLHDILLYHMVISDLVTAGCPSRARLLEDPDEAETRARIIEAVAYLPYIQNTSCAWGMRIILKDLYGWSESNINILTESAPPYEPALGSLNLRGVPCKVSKD